MNKTIIKSHFTNTINCLKMTSNRIDEIETIAKFLINKIKNNKKIFVYGNGGSFADGSHFVAELIATYNKKNRKALPFILLSSNMASLTAWSNDFNFNTYLQREINALSKRDDVLFILSSSGGNFKEKQSLNLIHLTKSAKKRGLKIVSLLGRDGGEVKKISDLSFIVKSNDTAIVQESHMAILHSISDYLDNKF